MKGVQRKPDYKANPKTKYQIEKEIEEAEKDKKHLIFSVEFIARHCYLRFTTQTYLRICRRYFPVKNDAFFLDKLSRCRNIHPIGIGLTKSVPAWEYQYTKNEQNIKPRS
jgi:hypothetical protein